MIKTRLYSNSIIVRVRGKNNGIYLKIDTGSPITVLSYNDAVVILDTSIEKLGEKIKKIKDVETYYTYSNGQIRVVKCCINNVNIGGDIVREFYFYLNTDIECKSTSLLGMDFIEKCTGNLNTGGNLTLNYQRWYKSNEDISDYAFIGSLESEYSNIKKDRLFLDTSFPDIL